MSAGLVTTQDFPALSTALKLDPGRAYLSSVDYVWLNRFGLNHSNGCLLENTLLGPHWCAAIKVTLQTFTTQSKLWTTSVNGDFVGFFLLCKDQFVKCKELKCCRPDEEFSCFKIMIWVTERIFSCRRSQSQLNSLSSVHQDGEHCCLCLVLTHRKIQIKKNNVWIQKSTKMPPNPGSPSNGSLH